MTTWLMSRRHHWVRVTFTVLSVGLVLVVTGGLLYAKHVAADALAAQRDIAVVALEISEQDSQEWRAVAGEDIGDVRAALALSRAEVELTLSGLGTGGSNVHVDHLVGSTAAYSAAVDRELSLLEGGNREAALEMDESMVDPAFELVTEEVAAATAVLATRARIAGLLSDWGIVGIVLLAVALVSVTDRRRRASDRGRREDAEHLALHDPLTALPNRRLFLDRIDKTLRRHQQDNGTGCLLYVDLDDFKAVNDSLGHAAGDELLILATQRLKNAVYPTDTLCRLGGDEFAVLLENADAEAGRRIGERLLSLLAEDFFVAGRSVRVSASVGVAVVDGTWPVASDVLRAADQAMYGAKRTGKGQVVLHEQEMTIAAARHGQLAQLLPAGMAAGEVTVAYQPIVDLHSGTTVAVEALARWQSPIWGRVSPAEFIPIAEHSGVIHELGRFVLTTACKDIAALNAARSSRLTPLGIAINVSTVQLRRGKEFLEEVAAALRCSGLSPSLLTFEITESTALSSECLPTLHEVRALGLGVALDDFGTGFASLTHVTSLPITELKIDRSFVKDLVDRNGDALASAILALGRQLELDVVAEGVETEAQRLRLLELGCHKGQGYLFEHPIDIDVLRDLLQPNILRAVQTTPYPAAAANS